MPTATETLRLLITADGGGAVKEIERVGSTAEREIGKTTNRLDKMGASFVRVGSVMVGAGALIGAGLYKAAQAAGEAEAAQGKLANALKNNPSVANANTDAYTSLASALQKKTAADDESIVAAQANLATFRLTKDQLLSITPLVVDYARRFGIELPQAAIAVGKAVSGNATALQKQGVIVDQAAYKTDRFGAVLTALRENAGGYAEQEGKTFAGQLAITKNSLGEVAEGIGRGAIPAFRAFLGPVQSVAQAFGSLPGPAQEAIGGIGGVGAAGLIFGGGALVVVGKVIQMREQFTQLSAEAPKAALAVKGFAMAAGAIAAFEVASQIVKQFVDDAKTAERVLGEFKHAESATAALDAFEKKVDQTYESMSKLSGDNAAARGAGGLGGFLENVTNRANDGQKSAEAMRKAFQEFADASPTQAQKVIDAYKAQGESTAEFEKILQKSVASKRQDQKVSEADAAAIDGAAEATDGLTDATDRSTQSALKALDARLALADADYAFRGSQNAATQAMWELNAAVDANNQAGGKNAEVAMKAMDAGYQFEGALLRVASAAEATANKQNENANETDKARAANDGMYLALMALANNASPAAQTAIQGVIDKLGLVPPDTPVNMSTNAGEVSESLDRLIGKMRTLVDLGQADSPAYRTAFNAAFSGLGGGHALGGRAEGLALVGERGPELVNLPSGSRVIPNGMIGNYGSSTGSSVTYNVIVNAGPGANGAAIGAELVSFIKQYERRNGRGWRN